MNGSWRIRRWRPIQQVHPIKYSFHPMNYSSHWQWRVASTLSCQHSLLHSSVSGPFWFKQLLKHGKAVGCFPFLAISPKRWCLHNLCKCLCSPPSWSGVSVPDCTQMFIITGSNKELCFMGCFWLQSQAHLVQPRLFLAGVDIQYNS